MVNAFDLVYGARDLERKIVEKIETPLSRAFLRGEFHEGEKLYLSFEKGELKILRNRQEVLKSNP